MTLAFRRLAVWAAVVSLLAGGWLPLGSLSSRSDADGVCGPTLVLAHSIQHFETARSSQGPEHCAFCHWRHTMASASAADLVTAVRPADAIQPVVVPAVEQPTSRPLSGRDPRGPPAVS